jgi:antibiotic biosynthesis monooxygenase (ABM) superfamily enzyme
VVSVVLATLPGLIESPFRQPPKGGSVFARVARFEGVTGGNPFDQVRDRALEILEALPGWQGGMQLLDREGGRVMNVALFDTEENMRAAETTFEEMPQRLGLDSQQMPGRRTGVERYEVVADQRK